MGFASKCFNIWCVFIQVSVWLTLYYSYNKIQLNKTATQFKYEGEQYTPYVSFIIVYILYLFSNLITPTFDYMRHLHKSETIHKLIEKLNQTPPKIKWDIECYHNETTYEEEVDSSGNTKNKERVEKVVTHKATEFFSFQSWRDDSGIFLLDSHKVFRSDKKVFIKLELELQVALADKGTNQEYKRQKDGFYDNYKLKDEFIDLKEQREVEGFAKYNTVKVQDKVNPILIGLRWYYLFLIFFPIVEIYKIYFNSFCIEQKFDIRKTITVEDA